MTTKKKVVKKSVIISHPSTKIDALGRKIEIAFIKDKSRRHITFSKRKAGIMKKVPPTLSLWEWMIDHIGLRIIRINRYPSPSPRSFGNWSGLHLYHSKIATPRN